MTSNEVFTEKEVIDLETEIINTYIKNDKKPILLLFRLYAKYWKSFTLSMIFYLIKQSPVIIMPIITANIINAVEACVVYGTDPFRAIIINIAIIGGLIVVNVPTNALYVKFYSMATRKVEAGLRGAMVKKLQQLSITFHKEMQSGRIQSKLMRDVESVHMLSTQLITTFPAMIVNIVAALSIVLNKSIVVFFFFLLCVPCNVALLRIFGGKIRKSNRDYRKGMEKTSASLNDMEEMTQITRAHALEEREVGKMTSLLKNIAGVGYRLDMIQAYFGSFVWVTIQIFSLACLVFSAVLYAKGNIQNIGDITLFQTYFGNLTGQVSAIIGLLPIITKGTESISSIGEILCATDVENNSGKMQIDDLKGEYEFKNISFSYETDGHLLDNFSLKVKAGETIAIVGESGSGKSTLINLAIGFIHAQSGQVLIDNNDIEDIDLTSYRRFIAIVPQNSVLFTGTIRENITYGLDNVTEEQIESALKASNMYDFVMKLPEGLDSKLNEHGANLSGGQRQRLSIARALIRNPKVIIFDEATSALDNISEYEIQKAINNLTENRTTFIVAHRLSTIRNADRIAVLKQGKCVELGTYEQLIAQNGEFAKMQNANNLSLSK